MTFFNIEKLQYHEARTSIQKFYEVLMRDYQDGDRKAGRYIGLHYLMEAAERGDVTSQIALGNLYENGTIVDRDSNEARRWYEEALRYDHPKADGTMLAAGAAAGLARLNA